MHAMTDAPPVPYLELSAEFNDLADEWLTAIRDTGAHGGFILGPQSQAFEREFA